MQVKVDVPNEKEVRVRKKSSNLEDPCTQQPPTTHIPKPRKGRKQKQEQVHTVRRLPIYPLLSHLVVGLNQQRPLVTSRFREYYTSDHCDFGAFPYLKNFSVSKGFWDSMLFLNLSNGDGYLDDLHVEAYFKILLPQVWT